MEIQPDWMDSLVEEYWKPFHRKERILLALHTGPKYLLQLKTELELTSNSSLERDLKRLERDGWIIRQENPGRHRSHRRSPNHYSLTQDGSRSALLLWLQNQGVDLGQHAFITDAGY